MGNWKIYNQDVMDWSAAYDGEPFHAMLCDPPYHLYSPVSKSGSRPKDELSESKYNPHNKGGFMGKKWDGGQIAFQPETWCALSKHLYDGAFGMAFASSRGWHRMATAIEDAGLILHPSIFMLGWVNGQGFPKATRIKGDADFDGHRYGLQAMKPSLEPIILFQKPYKGKPVENITTTGAGALWIDGARIGSGIDRAEGGLSGSHENAVGKWGLSYGGDRPTGGRWPSNVVLQHTPDCRKEGTKTIKGITGTKNGAWRTGGQYQGGYKGADEEELGSPVGFTDENGMEEVENWICADGCPVAEMNKQTGFKKSTRHMSYKRKGSSIGMIPKDKPEMDEFTQESGYASRFFLNADWSYEIYESIANSTPFLYQAKASRTERDGGLNGLPDKKVSFMNTHNGNPDEGSAWSPVDDRTGESRNRFEAKVKNSHPTVKSISLGKWLSTLLLPPDKYAPRRILNPFSGSGSEAIASLLSGWEEVVCVESDTENGYVDLSEARLKYWTQQSDKPRQFSLMELIND